MSHYVHNMQYLSDFTQPTCRRQTIHTYIMYRLTTATNNYIMYYYVYYVSK